MFLAGYFSWHAFQPISTGLRRHSTVGSNFHVFGLFGSDYAGLGTSCFEFGRPDFFWIFLKLESGSLLHPLLAFDILAALRDAFREEALLESGGERLPDLAIVRSVKPAAALGGIRLRASVMTPSTGTGMCIRMRRRPGCSSPAISPETQIIQRE